MSNTPLIVVVPTNDKASLVLSSSSSSSSNFPCLWWLILSILILSFSNLQSCSAQQHHQSRQLQHNEEAEWNWEQLSNLQAPSSSSLSSISTDDIVFLLHVSRPEEVESILFTWGSFVKHLYFFSRTNSFAGIDYVYSYETSAFMATWKTFQAVYEKVNNSTNNNNPRHGNQVSWFIKADGDTFFNLHSLRYNLNKINKRQKKKSTKEKKKRKKRIRTKRKHQYKALYFGFLLRENEPSQSASLVLDDDDELIYASGGAGYLLNNIALKRLVELPSSQIDVFEAYSWAEDVGMGALLAKNNIFCKSFPGLYPEGYELMPVWWSDHRQVPWSKVVQLDQPEYLSDIVSLHHVRSPEMHALHDLFHKRTSLTTQAITPFHFPPINHIG